MKIQPRYRGPGVNVYQLTRGYGWPSYLSFKSARRKPVKGGRWSVRRNPSERVAKPWRAWTKGEASRWSRSFATHGEAMAWATHVARTYAEGDKAGADMLLRAEKYRVSR